MFIFDNEIFHEGLSGRSGIIFLISDLKTVIYIYMSSIHKKFPQVFLLEHFVPTLTSINNGVLIFQNKIPY